MTDDAPQFCPICGAGNRVIYAACHDDRYGYPGSYPLLRCTVCGHRFLGCCFSSSQLVDLYSNFYPRSIFNLDQHQPSTESTAVASWLNGDKASPFRWVPKQVRVLDIGCGFGESLGYHQTRGCEVYGVEADYNIRRVADRYGYNVHVGLFDPEVYEACYFDYVTLSQVIEHMADPLATLVGIARVLKPGGMAILSTPNADGWGARVFGQRWINWHAPYHLHFFNDGSMRLAAEKAGLDLCRVISVTPSDWLYFQWLHLLSYPPANSPSRFWAPGMPWTYSQKIVRFLLKTLHRLKLNHIVTRAFDAMNFGDNRLYFLHKP